MKFAAVRGLSGNARPLCLIAGSMLCDRLSDFQSSNEVIMEKPLLTETLRDSAGERELLGPGPSIPKCFWKERTSSAQTHDSDSTRNGDTDVSTEDLRETVREAGGVKEGVQPGATPLHISSAFRWKKRSWPDGGRTNSLAMKGGGVLLSKRGWDQWRGWAAATSGGSSDESGDQPANLELLAPAMPPTTAAPSIGTCEDESSRPGTENVTSSANDVRPSSSTAREEKAGRYPASPTDTDSNSENDEDMISELAAVLDIELAGTCIALEPWEYQSPGATGFPQRENGGEKIEGDLMRQRGGDGPALLIRANMVMRMTSAYFLDGHWTTELYSGAFSPR